MQVKIVLVNPSHPGNIGAAARAMKTMGIAELVLVRPKVLPNAEAYARATHATDILDNCLVVDSLEAALTDTQLVIGTSARMRNMNWPEVPIRELKRNCLLQNTAIIFGNERTGLSNQELSYCNKILHIPTNPDCPSLNLAAAVQIVAYELSQVVPAIDSVNLELATTAELQHFYKHLSEIIEKVEFIKATSSESIMQKLNCLFQRAQPLASELAILRGILTSIERKL